MHAAFFQLSQKLHNAVVRAGLYLIMRQIISFKQLEGLVKLRIFFPLRNRPLHQHTDTVSHKTAHILNGMFRKTICIHDIVDRVSQILQGI